MFEITRFARQICYGKKIIYETSRKKFTKGDVIKKVMKEQKAAFGALLETKREKTRRLKLEKKGVIPVKTEESDDSAELKWTMQVSGSRLQRIKINQNDEQPPLPVPTHRIVVVNSPVQHQSHDTDTMKKISPKIEENTEGPVLSKVQNRIIRKTGILGTVAKTSPVSTTCTENNTTNIEAESTPKTMKKSINQSKMKKSLKIAKVRDKTLTVEEPAPKKKEIVVKPILPLLAMDFPQYSKTCIKLDKKHREEPIVLSSENILENIDQAQLFDNDEEVCINVSQNSEILSISRTENKECLVLPSVVKILNATMSNKAKMMLEMWKSKMIAELGLEGFNEYKADLLKNGKILHYLIENELRNLPAVVPEHIKPCFSSLKNILDQVQNVRAIESHVIHQDLGYRGVIDCVATYRGNLCLIDWKKSDKTKTNLSATYDGPLQIASYIGALNADKNYPFQIKSGVLVVGYTTGMKPTVYELSSTKLQFYWRQWLGRLKKYYTMQNS